jgi:serine/threonine-protein kinase
MNVATMRALDPSDWLLRAVAEVSEPPESQVAECVAAAARAAWGAGDLLAGKYRLDCERGRGGMAVVWEATHVATARRVAVKVASSGSGWPSVHRRLVREARAASLARHPNVVRVLDSIEVEGTVSGLVLELLHGETLRARLERDRRLSQEDAVSILLPVVAAMRTAHARGVVHRDLKPDNIFLARGAEDRPRVKVLDFGVATVAGDAETEPSSGVAIGTPGYMAPEQAAGDADVDSGADVWALGAMFYECLGGTRPVVGSRVGRVSRNRLPEAIQPIGSVARGVSPELGEMIMGMLAPRRDLRPRDLGEVERTLSRLPVPQNAVAGWRLPRRRGPAAEEAPRTRRSAR